MNRESRKASRDGLARQRANLHFSGRAPAIATTNALSRGTSTGAQTLRDVVRNGLIGFVPKPLQ